MVKSNLAGYSFSIHTANKLWGTAMNAFDNTRSCGGSSGGDGGLVGARCVPFGIGTDTIGSIKIPASFNGTRGFRPTGYRTSNNNSYLHPDLHRSFNPIPGVLGPLA